MKRARLEEKEIFFDDCPICQYSKKQREAKEPETYTGLIKAYKVTANLPDFYVGGPEYDLLFDDDEEE